MVIIQINNVSTLNTVMLKIHVHISLFISIFSFFNLNKNSSKRKENYGEDY